MNAGRKGGRRGGAMLRVGRLPPPPGAPGPVWSAYRRVRIALALGEALASQLVDVRVRGERIELHFAGERWEERLAPTLEAIERRLAAELGRERVSVVVRSRPDAVVERPGRGGGRPGTPAAPSDGVRRLSRLAQRLSGAAGVRDQR